MVPIWNLISICPSLNLVGPNWSAWAEHALPIQIWLVLVYIYILCFLLRIAELSTFTFTLFEFGHCCPNPNLIAVTVSWTYYCFLFHSIYASSSSFEKQSRAHSHSSPCFSSTYYFLGFSSHTPHAAALGPHLQAIPSTKAKCSPSARSLSRRTASTHSASSSLQRAPSQPRRNSHQWTAIRLIKCSGSLSPCWQCRSILLMY